MNSEPTADKDEWERNTQALEAFKLQEADKDGEQETIATIARIFGVSKHSKEMVAVREALYADNTRSAPVLAPVDDQRSKPQTDTQCCFSPGGSPCAISCKCDCHTPQPAVADGNTLAEIKATVLRPLADKFQELTRQIDSGQYELPKTIGEAEAITEGYINQASERLEQAIRTKYISRDDVAAAIGQDESTVGLLNYNKGYKDGRNDMRRLLRRELGK